MGTATGRSGRVLGRGAVASGPLDGLDPRTRVLGAVLFAATAVALSRPSALLAALALAAGLAALARLPLRRTLARLAALEGFVLLVVAALPFTVPGDPAFSVLGLVASREGLLAAAEVALTANAVVLSLTALAGAMEPAVLGHALGGLGAPRRLVHLLLLTVRYVDVLEGEARRLALAMRARGFRPATDRHTLRTLGHLVGMLLVRSVERSERVLAAMKCRGYDGTIPLAGGPRPGWRDGVFLALLALAATCLVLWEKTPWRP